MTRLRNIWRRKTGVSAKISIFCKWHTIQNTYARVFSSRVISNSTQINDRCGDFDKGHGRIEHRLCYVSDHIDWLTQRKQWQDLKTIARVESRVTIGKKTSIEQRYFISSLPQNAKQLAEAIRSHGAVENSLPWILDVTLREDDSIVRKDHAPANMAMVRYIILNMLQDTKKKVKDMSIKRLQKKAGWGNSTLDMILMAYF